MTYPTPRLLRFCAWCHSRRRRFSWLAFGYWQDDGEPSWR